MGHRYELPIVSFAAAILVLLPLPWHWKARNVATLSLIGWLFICNIIRGINSIIWMDNVAIHFHVWCDIATKLLIGVSIALPACSLTLTRHLEHVASVRYGLTTAAEKRRRRIIDLCFTIGIPLVMMALHYVVQGHRFDIVEDIGCQPVIYTSLSGVLLMFGTPLLLSVCSLVYAGLALRHFAIRRLQFEQHLRDSKSAMTTARYMRLMALALTEMVWGVSLGTFVVFENITQSGLRPWVSFADVHYNFSRVAVFPNFLVPNMAEVLLIWWITPSTAILFFVFFGFSDEAREGYKSIWRWICRKVFRRDFSQSEKITSLPQYRGEIPPVRRMRLSLDEISLDFATLKKADYLPPSYSPAATATGITDDYDTCSRVSITLPKLTHDNYSPTSQSSRSAGDATYTYASSTTLIHEPPPPGVATGVHVSTLREIH